MVGRLATSLNPDPARPGRVRRRTAWVAVLAILPVALAGCGDPDDDDGGGGGYVAAPPSVAARAPVAW